MRVALERVRRGKPTQSVLMVGLRGVGKTVLLWDSTWNPRRIVTETHGYPYFLQEWGKHVWDTAERSPITANDVEVASASAIAALDESFFRVRFDRLTPVEKRYLRAMAELGPGPHRSGDIADQLNRPVTSLGPTRNNLILKGMVWSPAHGDTAFTVPLFDEFMVRIMPGDGWRDQTIV